MPGKQKEKPERTYPALEEFIERAAKDAPKKLFAPTRKKLSELGKGPKGPAALKVLSAIDRAEGLLLELLDLRESLASQAPRRKGRR